MAAAVLRSAVGYSPRALMPLETPKLSVGDVENIAKYHKVRLFFNNEQTHRDWLVFWLEESAYNRRIVLFTLLLFHLVDALRELQMVGTAGFAWVWWVLPLIICAGGIHDSYLPSTRAPDVQQLGILITSLTSIFISQYRSFHPHHDLSYAFVSMLVTIGMRIPLLWGGVGSCVIWLLHVQLDEDASWFPHAILLCLTGFCFTTIIVYQRASMERYAALLRATAMCNERELAAEARALVEGQVKFLTTMGHELRTPLTAVFGAATLLHQEHEHGSDYENSERAELAHIIMSGSRVTINLIDSVLDYIALKKGDGNLTLRSRPVVFSHFIRTEVCSVITKLAKEKDMTVVVNVDKLLEYSTIDMDNTRVQQILFSFASNAIKFSPKGSQVTISVTRMDLDLEREATATCVDESDRDFDAVTDVDVDSGDSTSSLSTGMIMKSLIRFAVKDAGHGIPKDKFDDIFEPFVQLGGDDQGTVVGTGLGLSISRDLAKLMDGRVWIESEINEGSTFFFEAAFPVFLQSPTPRRFAWGASATANASDLERVAASSTSTPTTPVKQYGSGGSPLSTFTPQLQPRIRTSPDSATVLVAEDQPLSQRVIGKMIQKAGFNHCIVNNGAEAVKEYMTAPNRFFLVIMDLQMPIMDGFRATREIRRFEAENTLRPIPCVALTAESLPSDRKRCLDAGMTGYMAKPVGFTTMADTLHEHAERHASEVGLGVENGNVRNEMGNGIEGGRESVISSSTDWETPC